MARPLDMLGTTDAAIPADPLALSRAGRVGVS